MRNPDGTFIKGISGNPRGRPLLPEDLRLAKQEKQEDFERIMIKLLDSPIVEIDEILKNPDTDALTLLVGSIIGKALKEGDHQRFNFLLDRLIGKAKENFQLTGPDGGPIEIVRRFKDLPDEELLKMLPDAIKLLKGADES